MKILVSAYACEPGKGSEPGVGWSFVNELAKKHNVTVLTRKNNKDNILNSNEIWVTNVQWLFFDPPKYLTFWKRKGFGVQLFYIIWQISALKYIKKNLKNLSPDCIHHITFGKYWVPTFLGKTGIPTFFGPVGGGDTTPPCFKKSYSISGKTKENIKNLFSYLIPRLPLFKSAYNHITLSFAATKETASKLSKFVDISTIEIIPQSGLNQEQLIALENISNSTQKENYPLFVTACRLEHWKAVHLAIKAFKNILQDYPNARLEVIGDGPEKRNLIDLANRLQISNNITFINRLDTLEEVYTEIAKSTALLHPALHEAFGQVCVEAQALGTPVICWDWGGPGIITENNGTAVPVKDTEEESISSFSEKMIEVIKSPPPKPLFNKKLLWENIVLQLTDKIISHKFNNLK